MANCIWSFLSDRFRDIVVSGDEKLVKPDAAIYRLALDRFGIQAAEAVFVDDNAANVAGARAGGMKAIAFTSAATLRADLIALGLLGPVNRPIADVPAPAS